MNLGNESNLIEKAQLRATVKVRYPLAFDLFAAFDNLVRLQILARVADVNTMAHDEDIRVNVGYSLRMTRLGWNFTWACRGPKAYRNHV